MNTPRQFTAIIGREGESYVALCPEPDVASRGETVESARTNLIEAIELFLETADAAEVEESLQQEVFVTRLEVSLG